ncbi:MAG: HAD family hydrolase [Dehalococcoidales bacterium]|nr:MAG: HAD family hydrolase [Dehalococcoidales bacterium]
MPRAILFDLDDTILAYDAVADKCWHDVCRRYAVKVPGLESDRLLAAINGTRDWYWNDPLRMAQGRLDLNNARRDIVSRAFSSLGINAPALASELADSYSVERELAIVPVPGAVDMLNHFRNHSCRLALVTNGASDAQRRKIERFGLASLFDYILVEGEFGTGKPDQRVFRQAMEQLYVEPSGTWMVGDDLEIDIAGAQELGIISIWVDWRGQGLPESTSIRSDRIIRTVSELV